MKIQCSSCDQRLEIPEELAGQTIECPACNTSLTVPALAAAPPPLPTPPPPIAPAQNQRKAQQATSSRKTNSPFPKWAIAVFVGVALIAVAAILFIPRDQNGSSITQKESTTRAPNTPINTAALAGNIDVIKKHIDAGTNLNKRRGLGQATPLMWASAHNHKEIVELLISAGADVNITEGIDRGWTALDAALNSIFGDGKEIAALLRKHGGKTSKELNGGEPVAEATEISIHDTVWQGNIEAVKQHLAAGTDVNAKNKYESTPLHNAAFKGHMEIAELLIEKGADVNAKGGLMGGTPLHEAANKGSKKMVELLIANGADVNAKNKYGDTPLHEPGYGWALEIFELLIDKGADINAKNEKDETPLDIAKKLKRRPQIAALLLKHGGKTGEELNGSEPVSEAPNPEQPTAKDTDYSGTYTIPAPGRTMEVTFELKTDGSFIGAPSAPSDDAKNDRAIGSWKLEGELLVCEGTIEKNLTKLIYKFNKSNKKWISLSIDGEEVPIEGGLYLKKSGVPVAEAAKSEPQTAKAPVIPIQLAAAAGNVYAVKQHLAAGTNVNDKDSFQKTPLYKAVEMGHKEVVELLINNGADVNIKNWGGFTPLHQAKTKEITELLINKGADVNVKTELGGATPLDYAILYKRTETAALLRKHGGKTGTELEIEGK